MMNKQDKIIAGLIILILFIVWSKFMVASGYSGTTPILTEVTSYPISIGKDIDITAWNAATTASVSGGLGDTGNTTYDAQLASSSLFNMQWGDVNRQCWSDVTNASKIIGFRKELKKGGGGQLWFLYSTDGKMPTSGSQAQTKTATSIGNVGNFSIPQYLIATKSKQSPWPDNNCITRTVALKACSQSTCGGAVGSQAQLIQLIKQPTGTGFCTGPDGYTDFTTSSSNTSITSQATLTAVGSSLQTTGHTTAERDAAVPSSSFAYFTNTATAVTTTLVYVTACAAPGCKGGLNFIQNSGTVNTIAGGAGASAASTDGTGQAGTLYANTPTFATPNAICVGGGGSSNVFVLDSATNKIRIMTANTYTGGDGYWQVATVPINPQANNNFKGLACDFNAVTPYVYVSESGTGTSRISQFTGTAAGTLNASLAISGAHGAVAADSNTPASASNVYLVVGNNITLIALPANGAISGATQALQTLPSADATAAAGSTVGTGAPTSLLVLNGFIYYTLGHAVMKIPLPSTSGSPSAPQAASPSSTVVAGSIATAAGYVGSANGSSARFSSPCGLAADVNNNIYVTDTGNNVIRKISTGGDVTVFAGGKLATSSSAQTGTAGSDDTTGTASSTFPGGGATFSGPKGIALDNSGTMYVADTTNNIIRRIV